MSPKADLSSIPNTSWQSALSFALLLCLPLLFWSSLDLTADMAADAWPAMLGIPLLGWLGGPWRLRRRVRPLPIVRALICGLVLLAGFATGLTFVFAVGWTGLLWILIWMFVKPDAQRVLPRLMLIAIFSFPWVVVDGRPLGWCFRITGAWTCEHLLSSMGFDVVRQSTMLFVNDLRISVGEGCAGVGTLQSMLLGGAILAYAMLHGHRRFWWNIPILIAAAWLANTARVGVTGLIALSWGPGYAEGALHEWEGLIVLSAMFLMCFAAFAALRADTRFAREAAA